MMKKIVLLVIVLGGIYLFPGKVWGCQETEIGKNLNKKEIKKFYLETFKGAIFTGRVLSVKEATVDLSGKPTPVNEVSLEVETHWFGVKAPVINVYSGFGDGDCTLVFEKGKRYFFAVNDAGGFLLANFMNSEKIDSMKNFEKRTKFFDDIYGAGKTFPKTN